MKIRFILDKKRIAKLAKNRTLTFRVGDSSYEIKLDGVDIVPIPEELLDQFLASMFSDPTKRSN